MRKKTKRNLRFWSVVTPAAAAVYVWHAEGTTGRVLEVLTICLLAAATLGVWQGGKWRRRLTRPQTIGHIKLQPDHILAPRSFPQDVKIAAAVRDGGRCVCRGCHTCNKWRPMRQLCGHTEDIQFDHDIPWSQGGPSTLENCLTKCGPCNRTKGANRAVGR
jgi:hypothetical protein